MTTPEVMSELAALGSEATKRVLLRHGAKEPFFGVKIGDMKPLAKRLKGRQELAMELYQTGNGDAQYLAGMVADGRKMTRAELNTWAQAASWDMISGTTVPWVAHEHAEGFAAGREWLDFADPRVAQAGWATLCAVLATVADEKLPLDDIRSLLARVERTLAAAPDRVRYGMNNFVIAAGTYVAPLAEEALAVARRIGRVEVDMGETACQVPVAAEYIVKSRRGAPVATKRRTIRC